MGRIRFVLAILLFATCLVALSPANEWLDSSELVMGAHLLGISHPPGQPVYSLLCKLSEFLPIGNLAVRASLFSAIFLIFSFICFYKVTDILFKDIIYAGVNKSNYIKSLFYLGGLYFFLSFHPPLAGAFS